MSDQPMWTFKLEEKLEEKTMPYDFTPDERIAHLLYCIEKLNDILHDCDTRFQNIFVLQIESLMDLLEKALTPQAEPSET